MSDDEEAVLAKWGSWDALDAYLDQLVRDLSSVVCGPLAPVPTFEVKPTWLACGLLGGQHSGADYEPAEEQRPAVIGLFPAVLTDEALLRLAAAHELVHHWEHLGARGADELSSSDAAAAIIAARFTNAQRERRWRSGHSSYFIAKASSVAATLGVELRRLLFS